MTPYSSAKVLLPIVLDGRWPGRAIDLGCGDMSWLRALHELDPRVEMLGIDRDPAEGKVDVETSSELIGSRSFALPYLQMDLCHPDPMSDDSRWRECDLVICLEVAEHLPPEHATTLVDLIGDVARPGARLLWSAATPGQGPYGNDDDWHVHHNERPHGYWTRLLRHRGFRLDERVTRRLRVSRYDVAPWYSSNMASYIREGA